MMIKNEPISMHMQRRDNLIVSKHTRIHILVIIDVPVDFLFIFDTLISFRYFFFLIL